MSVVRKLMSALGLTLIGLFILGLVLPDRGHRISPKSLEVAEVLLCAQELRHSGIEGAEAGSGDCSVSTATYQFLGAGRYKVVGGEFGQSAMFEVVGTDGNSSLKCFEASSKWFPKSCEMQ